MTGIDPGYDDFTFRPNQQANLWNVMQWKAGRRKAGRNTQHCTPDHWGTCYLMTRYNTGAFTAADLRAMDPDAPVSRQALARWTAVAMGHAPSTAMSAGGNLTRGELAAWGDGLR